MIKRIFSTIILAFIAASLFFASGAQPPAFVGVVQAAPTSLSDVAGIAAYTTIGPVELETVKPAFQMIEYQTADLVVGTLDLPAYETNYDPLVLVTSGGDIVAFYTNADSAAKLVDVISKNLDETLLENAVNAVAAVAGVVPTAIAYYDFGNPAADKMLLVAEYEPDGNAFTLQFESGNTYAEKSYAFYRTYAPSFSLDNDEIDQVDFVEANADYIGEGYYGTIYGRFTAINFDPEYLNTFAVEAGDHLGFGALAILYSGAAPYTAADKDFEEVIPLVSPGIDPVFDLIPGAFDKVSPEDIETGVVLNPTLEWDASTAPNYEYCIDTSAPDTDPLTDDCETEWISTGINTTAALSNLLYETTYYWQVRAINSYAVVEADGGTWGTFTTDDGTAPELFAKDVAVTLKEPIDSLSKVTMTWAHSYGAYYYEVCVDTTDDCIAPELWHNVGLATTATIGDLLLDTTYYWQVRAWNGFDDSGGDNADYYTYADGEFNWYSFDTRNFSKLRPMQDEVYNVTLPFMWEETPIAAGGYEYCIDQTDDDACDTSWKKVTDTSVVVKKLAAGTYFWQVRTFGGEVEANDGVWWEFDVLAKRDVSKINLFKVSPLDGAVDQPISDLELSWKTTKTAIGYAYCFFLVDNTDTTPISDDDTCTYEDTNWNPVGTDTLATISGLFDTTTYYWQVRANIGTSDEPDWVYADKGDYWAFTTP